MTVTLEMQSPCLQRLQHCVRKYGWEGAATCLMVSGPGLCGKGSRVIGQPSTLHDQDYLEKVLVVPVVRLQLVSKLLGEPRSHVILHNHAPFNERIMS